MRPLKLTMSAFGPYERETVIDFTALGDCSFFLIHGATGAGKTTILDAICYAFYGDASVAGRTGSRLGISAGIPPLTLALSPKGRGDRLVLFVDLPPLPFRERVTSSPESTASPAPQ